MISCSEKIHASVFQTKLGYTSESHVSRRLTLMSRRVIIHNQAIVFFGTDTLSMADEHCPFNDMFCKPFRMPTLERPNSTTKSDDQDISEPQQKKRRVSSNHDLIEVSKTAHLALKMPGVSSIPGKPPLTVKNSKASTRSAVPTSVNLDSYYNVLW